MNVESNKRAMNLSPGGRSGNGVRLSPIELQNRDFINDPALLGFRVEGREKNGDDYDKKRPDIVELKFDGFEYSILNDGSVRGGSFRSAHRSSATARP